MSSKKPAIERILFIPDTHAPYHDRKAWSAMMAAAVKWNPHRVIIQGDFADFHAVSLHTQNPRKHRRITDELAEVRGMIQEIDALGAPVIYTEGNHEDRLRRYIWQHASALDGIVTVQDLLGIPSHWKYIPYQQPYKLGKILIVHDVGKFGIGAVRQSMGAVAGSVIMGHIHRIEVVVKGNLGGGPHIGACFGWLGGEEADKDYASIAMRAQWQHGFGIGLHDRSSDCLTVFPVPILKGKALLPMVGPSNAHATKAARAYPKPARTRRR